MSIVNDPQDVLGLALKYLLTPLLEDEKYAKRVKKLKERVIIVELIDIYAITLVFNHGNISIEYGERPKYHLKISVTIEAFVGIAERKVGLIGAFLKRKIKAKKLYHIFTLLKFYKIFFPAIKAANENPAIDNLENLL